MATTTAADRVKVEAPPGLPVRRMPAPAPAEREALLTREWQVTNGLGGYASGTVSGVATRRYHGYLVAAQPPPFGRTMMLNHLTELLRLPDGTRTLFAGSELQGGRLEMHGVDHLEELCLEGGLPVWRYRVGDALVEKRLWMPQGENTVYVSYRLAEGDGPVRLKLRPSVNFRSHDAPVSHPLIEPYQLTALDDGYEIDDASDLGPLRLVLHGERTAFTAERVRMREMLYRIEEHRGYDSVGELMCMGYFRADLLPGHPVTLVASTEPWERFRDADPEAVFARELDRRRALLAAAHESAREGVGAELVLAADQFLITPVRGGKPPVGGEEPRTVIAGYHWFTDWGRDTMISLEGLTMLSWPRGRGAAHPAHLRRRHARRPHPQLLPRRRQRRRLPHRRRDALVLPRRRPLPARDGRPRDAARPAAAPPRQRRAPPRRHPFRHLRRSGRRAAAPGRAGLPAHLDGRQGRRVGGHSAAR